MYEKILKAQIFSNKLLTFDQFIQCFDAIIYNNDTIDLESKFTFLLNISSQDEFINSKKIQLFLDLLGCNAIYIQDFCEDLGERLVIRYNAVYKTDEEINIMSDKFKLRKMNVILQSFFDGLQFEE